MREILCSVLVFQLCFLLPGIFKRYLASSPVLTRNSASTYREANGTSMPINNVGAPRQNITDRNLSQATNALQNRTNSSRTQSVAQSPMDVNYPCLHPVNPHMRSSAARLETFKPTPTVRWPRERLRAGINEVTNAGFFYLGERDRVKCWYCNGGLQNWDYEDDPWTEHAKWFPRFDKIFSFLSECEINPTIFFADASFFFNKRDQHLFKTLLINSRISTDQRQPSE